MRKRQYGLAIDFGGTNWCAIVRFRYGREIPIVLVSPVGLLEQKDAKKGTNRWRRQSTSKRPISKGRRNVKTINLLDGMSLTYFPFTTFFAISHIST
jgi:hypothetical protein